MHTPLFNCNPPPGNPGMGLLKAPQSSLRCTPVFSFFFALARLIRISKGGTVTFRKEK